MPESGPPCTERLSAEKSGDLRHAAALLRGGRTVAFATETVYGLGAHALDPAAVARIFVAKARPAWDPLIVHVAGLDAIEPITTLTPALRSRVAQLAKAFWPGPLTLLLPRSRQVPDVVTAGRPLVGVRVPAHDAALRLLRLAALPVAAPSANRFGHTSPTTAAHVLADLDGRIDAVLDGGPCDIGVESTVFDPQELMIYRPGAVTPAQLSEVCGATPSLYQPAANAGLPEALPSPGVGIRHYAPRAQLILCEGTPEHLQAALTRRDLPAEPRTGVMLPDGWPEPMGVRVFRWGNFLSPDELAVRVFAGLRALDDVGVRRIICPLPPAEGLGLALQDRLQKAARNG